MRGRCHTWPWLIEFSGVVLNCFTLSRLTIFPDASHPKTGRLVQPIVQDNSLLSVVGQEMCSSHVALSPLSPYQGLLRTAQDGHFNFHIALSSEEISV